MNPRLYFDEKTLKKLGDVFVRVFFKFCVNTK